MALSVVSESRFRAWWEIIRPFSLTAALVPAAVGSVAAWAGGRGDGAALPLVVLGLLLTQSGTNVVNEVLDVARGVDTAQATRPSHVLVEHRLPDAVAYRAGLVLLALGVAAGGVLSVVFRLGPVPALLGLAGALIGYSYTGAPLQLKYRGLGLPAVALAMGPVAVLGAEYVQAGGFSRPALLASLPVGCLVGAILLANDIRDIDGDRAAGIRTGATLLGRPAAWRLYVALLATAYGLVLMDVAGRALPWTALLTYLSAPLSVRVVAGVGRPPDPAAAERALARLDVRSAEIHLLFGLLLATGLGLPGLWA